MQAGWSLERLEHPSSGNAPRQSNPRQQAYTLTLLNLKPLVSRHKHLGSTIQRQVLTSCYESIVAHHKMAAPAPTDAVSALRDP